MFDGKVTMIEPQPLFFIQINILPPPLSIPLYPGHYSRPHHFRLKNFIFSFQGKIFCVLQKIILIKIKNEIFFLACFKRSLNNFCYPNRYDEYSGWENVVLVYFIQRLLTKVQENFKLFIKKNDIVSISFEDPVTW